MGCRPSNRPHPVFMAPSKIFFKSPYINFQQHWVGSGLTTYVCYTFRIFCPLPPHTLQVYNGWMFQKGLFMSREVHCHQFWITKCFAHWDYLIEWLVIMINKITLIDFGGWRETFLIHREGAFWVPDSVWRILSFRTVHCNPLELARYKICTGV
jgi:hypothetical protein